MDRLRRDTAKSSAQSVFIRKKLRGDLSNAVLKGQQFQGRERPSHKVCEPSAFDLESECD